VPSKEVALSDFWERFLATALGGILAATFAATLGYWIAARFTARREEHAAQRQRAEAAAEEFYSAYGSFFAAWKSWNDFRGLSVDQERPETVTSQDRMTFLSRVADAEGQFETFLIWLTLERSLSQADLDRLWCFRRGYKQLRLHVRNDRRLPWTRTPSGRDPHKQYEAFKWLAASVAALIAGPAATHSDRPRTRWRGQTAGCPTSQARTNLTFVTGPSRDIRNAYRDSLPAELHGASGDKIWYVLPKLIDEREAAPGADGDGLSARKSTA
jgi:hypothetical protein